MFYLIGIVASAILWGLWPAIFTSVMSIFAFDFFFVPPALSFRVSDSEYFITFLAFLFVGVSISLLVSRMREYASSAQRRDDYTSTLYALSIDLASANEIDEVLEMVSQHVERACHCRSVFLVPERGTLMLTKASKDLVLNEKEITAANWTYKNGVAAGKGTETLSSAFLKYYPLHTLNGVVGVMGVQTEEQEGLVKFEQEKLLQAFANQAAVAIERCQLWNLVCRSGSGQIESEH
jgi:two-component system sensor histidine kinase KdpD